MKTKGEIQFRLDAIFNDERLGYPIATIDINAPLALIQLSLATQRDVLKWILKDSPNP